ncbi:MAG: oligosaccharide flippase family protein [Croceibacterium sp.]
MNSRIQSALSQGRELWRKDGVRNITRGGLTGIIAAVGNRALTIASAIVLARLLGSDGYGIYATAIAAMMILAVLAEFGMYVLLVREVSSAHARAAWGEILGMCLSAVRFTLSVSVIVAALGCAVIWMTPLIASTPEKWAFTLMLGLLPINTLYRLGSATLYGLRYVALAQVTEQFLLPAIAFASFATIYLAVGPGIRPAYALGAQIGSGALALLMIGLIVYSALAPSRANFAQLVPASRFQVRALPFLIMGAAGTITQQLDTLIVSLMMTNSDTAHYRVASQAATLTWFGVQILQSISSPYFARLFQQGDMHSLRRLYHWNTVLAVASATPVLLLFIFAGRWVIDITFGSEFEGAQPLMIVLSAGYLINVMCGPAGSLLAMTGEERWASRAFVIMSALAILISLSLVNLVGAIGVAFGTAFGFAGYHLVLRVHIRRRMGF